MAIAPASEVQTRRFTVREYERMAELGILADDERVELIEGEIVVMSRISSPHAACVNRLMTDFIERVGRRACVSVHNPIKLSEVSEPGPDIALARPREDFYQGGHPGAADLYLVVEVMDTSADYDRRVKLPLYARSNIAELWLIDLNDSLVEVHRRPLNGAYAEKTVRVRGPDVSPEAFPDVSLAVDAIVSRVEP